VGSSIIRPGVSEQMSNMDIMRSLVCKAFLIFVPCPQVPISTMKPEQFHHAALLLLVSVLFSTAAIHAAPAWSEYTGCQLDRDAYFDGDSFSGVSGLKVGGKRASKTNWRLYGVDCPETDMREVERVAEQAKYFGISGPDVLRWGKVASKFSERFLAGSFTVFTRREKAGGASEKNRYYAILLNADGQALHEALVEAGLARAYGWNTDWPERTDSRRFESRLKSLERSAKANKAGIWADSRK